MNVDKKRRLEQDEVIMHRAGAVQELLASIPGEDADREGLAETPLRVAAMYNELFAGYKVDASQLLKDAMFTEADSDDMVLVKDIEFSSMCEHHLMPFFGSVHVAYIPRHGRIVGLSKIARVVDAFAKRAQVQERMGKQIADTIQEVLDPLAVAVIISGEHTCMTVRGIKKPGAKTVTARLDGLFKLEEKARKELYDAINLK